MNVVHDLRRRGVLFWVGLAVAIIGVALLAGRPNRGGPPLDPTSSGPLGAKGLVLLLRELDADVVVEKRVGDESGTAAVLIDTLTDAQRVELLAWVSDGGTLLLADPRSPMSPAETGEPFGVDPLDTSDGPILERGRGCDLAAFAEVGAVQPPAGVPLTAPAGAVGCFPVEGGTFVVADDHGAGTIVAVGGAALFTNDAIGDADNAALAASVLAPESRARVTILRSGPVGGGQKSLSELISHRAKGFGWQLAIAFLFVAAWRARRLGRPVHDPRPVEIPGSELVLAVGRLLQRGHHRDRAASVLTDHARRTLCERFGLPANTPDAVLAEIAAARTGVGVADVSAVLAARPGADDALVRLAQQSEQLRQEVIHAR